MSTLVTVRTSKGLQRMLVAGNPSRKQIGTQIRKAQRFGALGVSDSTKSAASQAATYAAIGSKAGSIVPGVGNVIGAAVGAIFGAAKGLTSEQKHKEVLGYEALLAEGVRGRGPDYNPRDLLSAFTGLMRCCPKTNKFPPRTHGGYGQHDDDKFASDMAKKIAEAVRSGTLTPADTPDTVFERIVKPWATFGANWNHPNGQENLRLVRAISDNYIFGLPITLGEAITGQETEWPYEKFADVIKSASKFATPTIEPAQPSTPSVVTTPPSVISPSSGPVVSPTPTPPVTIPDLSVTPGVDVRSLIDTLVSQGRTQQETFASALQSLSNRGITVTPQVQATVAEQVKEASSGMSSSWIVPLGLVGGAAALFFLLRRRRR